MAKPTFLEFGSVRTAAVTVAVSLICSISALAIFAWLVEEVFEGEMGHFDLRVRMAVHDWTSPHLTFAMRFFTTLASPTVLAVLVLAACAAFVYVRRRDAAVWLVIAMSGALLLDVVLKQSFRRTRPTSFFDLSPHSYSFPSGHALGSFCFYGVLAGLVNARIKTPWIRALNWLAAAALAATIGLSRIYLGVHYPTDVLAGYVAAAVWIGVLVATDRVRRLRASSTAPGVE